MKHGAALAVVMLSALAGCSSEWRTTKPVTPSSYSAIGVRETESVGRLARLAVMTAELHREADARERTNPEWQAESEAMKQELQGSVTRFLVEQKGYDARAVDAPIPMGEGAVRETGQRLGVDGIVTVRRWIAKPWSTAMGIGNVFMMNIPLVYALNSVNLRISIHETASGRLVWQEEMKGADFASKVDIGTALGDLENAVPAQLRK